MLTEQQIQLINELLEALGLKHLTPEEEYFLNQLCNINIATEECLILYYVAYTLRIRNINCNAGLIDKLNIINSCNNCGIDLDNLINYQKPLENIYCGGLVVETKGCEYDKC